MKRVLWGVLILLSVVFSSYTLFQTTLYEQGCYYEGVSVIPSENGGWLVSCAYNCNGNSSAWKSCLVTLHANGDTLQVLKDLPYNGIMKATPDGNLVFAGGNHAGFTYDTAAIFKVTASGELLWKKNLFESYCHHLLTDILPLENGFLISGNYVQNSCSSPVYDSYIAKLNGNGDLLWKYDIKEDGNDQLHVVKLTGDNQIAAFGWTENKSSADDADYFLIKLDQNGNIIWSKTYGDEKDNYGYGMDVTPDGGFILNGHSTTMDIIKLDAAGNLQWNKSLTETCGGRYFKASVTMDGGLLFLGMEKNGTQPCKSALIKTNAQGEIFWKKNFEGVVRMAEEYHPMRYIITGYKSYLPKLYVAAFDTTTLLEQTINTEVQQIDRHENLIFADEQFIETATGELTNESIKQHHIYPNPASDIVHVEFANPEHKMYYFEIFDAQGKLLVRKYSTGNKMMIDEMLPKGIYNYTLSGDGYLSSGKIIFQ